MRSNEELTDLLIDMWPEFVEGAEGTEHVVWEEYGEWWVGLANGATGGFKTKREAVLFAIGVEPPS